jgi:hypothetical protein
MGLRALVVEGGELQAPVELVGYWVWVALVQVEQAESTVVLGALVESDLLRLAIILLEEPVESIVVVPSCFGAGEEGSEL